MLFSCAEAGACQFIWWSVSAHMQSLISGLHTLHLCFSPMQRHTAGCHQWCVHTLQCTLFNSPTPEDSFCIKGCVSHHCPVSIPRPSQPQSCFWSVSRCKHQFSPMERSAAHKHFLHQGKPLIYSHRNTSNRRWANKQRLRGEGDVAVFRFPD